MDGALPVVPAGSLDTSVPVRPDAHIHMSSRADREDRLEAIPKVDHAPQ